MYEPMRLDEVLDGILRADFDGLNRWEKDHLAMGEALKLARHQREVDKFAELLGVS